MVQDIGRIVMNIRHVEDFYFLLERAALKDRTAEMAAEVAGEAERAGQTETANKLWLLARRCRVHALELRGRAVAGREFK